jgi:cytochrome c-type biogenesis protein CcmE
MEVSAEVTAVGAAPRVRTTQRRIWLAGLVIVAALGFLVYKGLGSASVYFRTADEAVRDKASLGTRRFRIEGTVLAGSVHPGGQGVDFVIASKGVQVPVVHTGNQPDLFQPDIPVVLEGRWSGAHYASDRIMVKHTENYRAKNPQRVRDYAPAK